MQPANHMKILISIFCIFLQGCTERFYVIEPFKPGMPGQVFHKTFTIDTETRYGIFFIFNWLGYSYDSRAAQDLMLSGGGTSKGIVIPTHLRILKDQKNYFDDELETYGVDGYRGFCYDDERKKTFLEPSGYLRLLLEGSPGMHCENRPGTQIKNGPFRTLQIFRLPPGEYLIEIRSLKNIETINKMEIFIDLSPYDPKI